MKNWTIKKQIILGLSILILINIVVGIFMSSGISKLKGFVENLSTNQLRGIYVMGQIQSEENESYDLMLHHIQAETKDETATYNRLLAESGERTDRLIAYYQQNVPTDDQGRPMLDRVLSDRAAFETAWQPVQELSLALKNKDAFALFKEKTEPAFEKLKAALRDEIDYNKQICERTAGESIALTDNTSTMLNTSIMMMLVSGIAIAYVIVRSLNRVLTSVADTLGEGANQIVAALGPACVGQPVAGQGRERAGRVAAGNELRARANRQHDQAQ